MRIVEVVIRLKCNCNMKYDKNKSVWKSGIEVNIYVLGKMRIATLISIENLLF